MSPRAEAAIDTQAYFPAELRKELTVTITIKAAVVGARWPYCDSSADGFQDDLRYFRLE